MCDKIHYDALETRVTDLEGEVSQLRAETRSGFSNIAASIVTVQTQIANMDKRLVEEKEKWGGVLREVVRWTARALLLVASAAAGVNLAKVFVH